MLNVVCKLFILLSQPFYRDPNLIILGRKLFNTFCFNNIIVLFFNKTFFYVASAD